MNESFIVLIPLVVLAIISLFPILGCIGEDPDVAYARGKEEGKKEQEGVDKTQREAEEATKKAQKEAQKYDKVVGAVPDLVSYWRLSEGEIDNVIAKDSAPDIPRHGEYKNVGGGGVLRSVPGILSLLVDPPDKAAEFDGVKGYVEVPHDPLINPVQEFSVEAWMKPAGLSAQPQVVIGSYEVDADGNVVTGFVLDVFTDAAGGARVRARVGNGTTSTPIEASLEGGSEHDGWRHIVVTYSVNSKELKLYVNADSGFPDAQVPPYVFYVSNKTNPLRIAAGQIEQPEPSPAPGQFFKGRIDEVALYRIPLDGGTVKNHFLRGVAIVE